MTKEQIIAAIAQVPEMKPVVAPVGEAAAVGMEDCVLAFEDILLGDAHG